MSNPFSMVDWNAPHLRGSGPAAVDDVVLVTGAAGVIGSHVSLFLLDRGNEVVVVDKMNDNYDVRIKEGNLQLLVDQASGIAEKTAKE